MSDAVLNVSPDALRQAADGINGVIEGLAGGVLGSYTSQLGRGFDGLGMTGEEMSHPSAKDGMDDFVERWEWGTRALVTKANDLGRALDLGAGLYELQDEYFHDAARDMANDLIGDPSLQRQSTYNADGSVASVGTDDMSWGDWTDHNVNRLANPDWSAQSFSDAMPTVEQNWQSIQDNAPQAGRNLVIPGAAAQSTIDGFMSSGQEAAPASSAR